MRGDLLVRLWLVLRGIEASPNELTAAEIAWPDGTLETARKRSPSKACSKSWNGFSDTFFKWPGLVGKGNKAKAFNYVPAFVPQLFSQLNLNLKQPMNSDNRQASAPLWIRNWSSRCPKRV